MDKPNLTPREEQALAFRRKGFTYYRVGRFIGRSETTARRLCVSAKLKIEATYPGTLVVI